MHIHIHFSRRDKRPFWSARAIGQIAKQIAAAEGISEPTVREHLEKIKRKLCTDDLVNAVVIAVKTGMLFPQPSHTAKH